MTNAKSWLPLLRPTSWRVAAAGRRTGDGGVYLLSLPENGRGYVRFRSHIRARFPVAWKGPHRAPRPLPRASQDRRYNTLHFARQSGVPKGSAPICTNLKNGHLEGTRLFSFLNAQMGGNGNKVNFTVDKIEKIRFQKQQAEFRFTP